MDTKWKKSKLVLWFGAFLVGISLVLYGVASLATTFIVAHNAGDSIPGIMEEDYQNRSEFRYYMEDKFHNFVSIATGSELYGYYNVDTYYDDMEYGIAEESVAEGNSYEINSYDDTSSYTQNSEKERKEIAEQYLKSISQDKNLLYKIESGTEVLYTNMEDVVWETSLDTLPEGYNFLLYFDGEKVTMVKDGKELDVYGNGIYDGDGQWYVPGYQNFTVDESLKDVKIVMLASKTPVMYSYIKSGQNNSWEQYSDWYYMARDAHRNVERIKMAAVATVVGILLCAAAWIFRKQKRELDSLLGEILGHIWVEAKIAVLFLVLLGSITTLSLQTYEAFEAITYTQWEILPQFFTEYLLAPKMIVVWFWLIYLLVIDIRANGKRFWNGLLYRLINVFSTKSLRMSFAKRLVFRFVPICLVSLLLIIVGLAVMMGNVSGYTAQVRAVFAAILMILFFCCICLWYLSKMKKQALELDALANQIQRIHDGNYNKAVTFSKDAELAELWKNLEEIRQGLENAIDERMKSERMKVELVANVSHDIKTPLTSIISYIQFLKQEENLPEHVKDYIRILDQKSERLNHMVQDVFSVSKAASGQLPVEMEDIDFAKLLRQTLADMDEEIKKSQVVVKTVIPEKTVKIMADGKRMYRVFQNLIQNALKYSLEGSRVYITLKEDGEVACASIKNTSRQELETDKDFSERFVRGDESRTDGGSGLGLSIAKSFTEACGGTFKLETMADLFVVTIQFHVFQ